MSIAQVDTATVTVGAVTTLNITGVDVSGTNRAIYVAIDQDTGSTASSAFTVVYDPTGHNQAMVEIGDIGNPGQHQAVFRLTAADPAGEPGTGTNLTIAVSGMAAVTHNALAVVLSGVDPAAPNGTVDQVELGSGTSTSSGTITSAAGDWILSFLALGSNFTAVAAAGGGQAIQASIQSGGPASALVYGDDRDGADDTFDWTWTTSQRYSLVTFNVMAAAAGAAFLARPNLQSGQAVKRASEW